MPYEKQLWEAREGEGLNKFTDLKTGNVLELVSTPDSVVKGGSPFSTERMNHMEDGIYEAYALAEQALTGAAQQYVRNRPPEATDDKSAGVVPGHTWTIPQMTFHNLVPNAPAPNAPAWTLSNGSLASAGTKVRLTAANGLAYSTAVLSLGVAAVPGNLYFFRGTLCVEDSGATRCSVILEDSNGHVRTLSRDTPAAGTAYTLNTRFEMPDSWSGTLQIRIRLDYSTASAINGKRLTLDAPIVWDLTTDMPDGLEFTEAQAIAYAAQFAPVFQTVVYGYSGYHWVCDKNTVGAANWASILPNPSPDYAGTLVVKVTGEYATGRVSVSNDDTGTVITTPDTMGEASFSLLANKTYTVKVVDLPSGHYTKSASVKIVAKETQTVTLSVTTTAPVYGFRVKRSDGSVEYTEDAAGKEPASMSGVFSGGDWLNEWPFSEIVPCLLKNGVVTDYLDPNNYAKTRNGGYADITSGDGGDVMIEFPLIYTKEWSDGTYDYVNISPAPLSGYHANGFTNANGAVQATAYMAAYDGYNQGGKLRSLSGFAPTVSQNIGTFRGYATGNGAGYQQHVWSHRALLYNLFILMFKGLNSQSLLGKGVTGASAAVNTGSMNTKGMYWGDQSGTNGVKFCGIEHVWGNIRKWCDGLGVNSGNKIVYKVRAPYNDSLTGYLDTGVTRGSSGWASQMTVGNGWGKVASALSGSESTFYADYWYFNSSAGTYLANVGGIWGSGANAGLFYVVLNCAASDTNIDLGASLSYIPQ